MAVPRKKISIAKKHQRTSTWRTLKMKKMMKKLTLIKCSNCGEMKQRHTVCTVCGYFKGKQILTIKTKKSDSIIEA